MGLYLSALSSLVRPKETERVTMVEFPEIKSKHYLVAKHVTKERWDKLSGIVTKTSGFTLAKAIACAVEFDNQHSLSGSMKKISSELFPCKREVMYEVYSKDWPEVLRLYKTPSRLNPARTSNCPKSSVTFTLAQPILELA